MASEVVESIDKKKELKLQDMLSNATQKAISGGIGGGVGAFMGSLTNAALTSEMANKSGEAVNNFVNQFIEEFSDDLATAVLILKKMAEGGVSSGSSRFATGFYENLQEKDSTKKKDLKTQAEEAFQSAFIGAVISGITACAEQAQKIQKYNQTKKQIEQTQRDYEEAKAQKAKSESALQELQKTLKQSEQNLLEKQKALTLQEQSLQEKKLQQQQAQERIEKDQQAISKAQTIASTAEQELRVAQQSLIEAQQQVDKHQQAISEAQKIAGAAEQQLRTATQTAQEAQQAHNQLVAGIDKDIRHHVRHGYKAKVNGHYTKNEEKIRNAYLQGGKIEWKKGQNRVFGSRETIKMKPSPLMEKYQQAQEHAKQTEQKIQGLQSSINQKQAELKIAEDKLSLQRQSVDQTQAELKAAQEVQLKQAELKIAQEQLTSYQGEIQQAQQDMIDTQGAIKALEQQTSQFEAKLQEEFKKLQAIVSKESGLATLSKEQQEVIQQVQHDYDSFLQGQATRQYLHLLNRGALKKAFKPDPVSYVEADCSLEELVPHVVLVHALNHQSPPESIEIEMIEKCQNEEEQIVFYMQKVVAPDGSVGNHLQLKKIEFDENLSSRPHLHWAWNQLVQPNGGLQRDGTPVNSWEKAKIAFLEPLSTIENGIYYKPFGVTPYDTFTFNSHRFSEKSILLAPRSVVDKVKMNLTGFRGRIVPYNDKESLRSVIVDALQAHYPETWHICDAKGNLTGKKMQYSPGGFSPQTCIKKADGKVIVLINNSGFNASTEHKSEAIKEWHKGQRFIGLHANSITFWIEDKENKYFETLKKFKRNHATVKDHPLFAGSVKDIHALAQLGALKALQFYQKSSEYDLKTGIIDVANYIINEAIYADLASLFYQMNPTAKFDLSILDLTMIFESTQLYLLNLLENIKIHIENKDSNQQQKAMHFFTSELSSKDPSYCSILKQSLIDIRKAKEEALKKLTKVETESTKSEKKAKPLCLLVAQDKWEKIETPADSIEFDLGKNWPYSDQLRKYANKVLRTLPKDTEKLQQLYQQLSSYSYLEIRTPEERKEQYRLNIICSMIQWALQEKIYLASREEYTVYSSILVNKLSKQIGWLAEYGLETEDFTLNIGDCLFDNIVAQLPSSTLTSLQLRKELIQYMQKHSEAYSGQPDYYNENELCVGDGEKSLFFENWEQYLTCMGQSQVWGTELEIQALSSYLDCPIVLLTVGMQPKIYNSESKNPPLFLHHLNDNHFEACIQLKGLTIKDVYNGIKNQPHF